LLLVFRIDTNLSFRSVASSPKLSEWPLIEIHGPSVEGCNGISVSRNRDRLFQEASIALNEPINVTRETQLEAFPLRRGELKTDEAPTEICDPSRLRVVTKPDYVSGKIIQ